MLKREHWNFINSRQCRAFPTFLSIDILFYHTAPVAVNSKLKNILRGLTVVCISCYNRVCAVGKVHRQKFVIGCIYMQWYMRPFLCVK